MIPTYCLHCQLAAGSKHRGGFKLLSFSSTVCEVKSAVIRYLLPGEEVQVLHEHQDLADGRVYLKLDQLGWVPICSRKAETRAIVKFVP